MWGALAEMVAEVKLQDELERAERERALRGIVARSRWNWRSAVKTTRSDEG